MDRKINPLLAISDYRWFGQPCADYIRQEYLSEEKCPLCERIRIVKDPDGAEVEIKGRGRQWPDVLGSISETLFHERVVEVIMNEGLKGFIPHATKIVSIKGGLQAPPPRYYLLEITGRFDVDENELDNSGGHVCPLCFYRNGPADGPYQFKAKRIVPKQGTWDGSDILLTRNLQNMLTYCSWRFIELAHRHRWTNFIFGESLPGITLRDKAPEGRLSYHDPQWSEKFTQQIKAKHADLFA